MKGVCWKIFVRKRYDKKYIYGVFFLYNGYFLSLVTFVTEITGKMWYYYDAGDKNIVFYLCLMKILIEKSKCIHMCA